MPKVSQSQAEALVGKHVYAMRRDGRVVEGRLVRVSGNHLVIQPRDGKAHTQAILPLALFDLLALSTVPFGFGFGFPFGGFWW